MVSEQFDPSGVLPPFPSSSFGFAPAIPTPLLFQFAPAISPTPSSFDSMATTPSTTPYFTAPYSFPARNPHPSPFPFFSPPPPPAPTPTPFTAPSAFGAPASGSPPIPPPPAYPYAYTAATAAPPYGVPPPPPQAYYYPPPTNPYLPFASAYTPASGFSPLPPPVPNPTPPTASQIHGDLHAPPQESTAPPPTGAPGSTSPSTQPWVASSPSPGLASGPIFIPTTASASKMQPDPAPLFEPFDAFHTSTSRRQPDHAPAANPKHSSLLKLPGRDVSSSCPTFLASREVQAREEATISKNMPRAVLDLKRRLDEQQARDRNSFGSLQGQLTKLKLMASQLEISISKHANSVRATTASISSGIGAAVSFSASSGCSHFDASATAYVVPHKFSEMPQSYSLRNLNCKSIVRADGTEHNYFTLPSDYPLERASLGPVFDAYDDDIDSCSTEFVDVLVNTPEQQINGVEQQEDDQPLKCFCKPPETELNSACLYNLSDVQDFTFEVQPQDDKRACSDPVRKPSDSLAPRCSQLSIDQSMRDLKLQWDPRDTKFHILFRTAAGATRLQCTIGIGMLQSPTINSAELLKHKVTVWLQWDPGIVISLYMYIWPGIRAVKTSTWVRSPLFNDLQYQLQMRKSFSVWDPRILSIMGMTLGKTAVPNQVHSGQTPCEQVILIGQPVDLKKFSARLLLLSSSWYYNCLLKTPYISDPVLDSLLLVYICLNIHKTQLVDCTSSANHACYIFVTSGSLPSGCLGSHLHQISKWTSTTPNAMRSFEYGYTMHNLSEQWEFSHQQDIKKYCNEKNLLSSSNYLQSLEIDILFITFLPP